MRTALFCLAVTSFLLCSLSYAQWIQTNGPYGEDVSTLGVKGTSLFAGTNCNGVFRSTDNGASWTAANNGMPVYDSEVTRYARVNCFVSDGVSLYAGTWRGVFLSTDDGTRWVMVSSSSPNTAVTSLVFSEMMLFAGTENNGILFSSNNGASWAPANNGLTRNTAGYLPRVYTFAIIGTGIFAGTSHGAFRSTNSGAMWTEINGGIPKDKYGYLPGIASLAVNGTTLFAGTFAKGVFRSTDNGTSWTAASSGLPRDVSDATGYVQLSSLASNGGDLLAGSWAGVFRSTDNGATWTAVNSGLTNNGVTCLAVSGTDLFAGTDGGGVYRSADRGTHWTAASSGLTNLEITCFASSGERLFAGTYGAGVFLSTDNGACWTDINQGVRSAFIAELAVSGTTLFAGALHMGST